MAEEVKDYENVYELWYEWLKTTDSKDWSQLMKDTLVNCDEDFPEWWEECKQFFLPALDLTPLWVIKDENDYQLHHEAGDPEGELIVALNVYAPKLQLIRAFQKLLIEKLPGKVGRPKHDDSAADVFELCRRPDAPTIRSLNIMLKVYKEWLVNPKPLWKIGEKLKLNPSSQSEAPERAMTATVSRYLRWAKTLRKNIIKGQFPKYK